MLLQFSVENFKSFRNKAVLSLEASADKEHTNNYFLVGNSNVLNTVTIFGANAAGKSNLFQALQAALLLIRTSNNRQPSDKLALITPFKFDREAQMNPSSFEFVFFANNTKYVYGFSATQERVVSEYLYCYKTSKATTVFEREGEDYRFTNQDIRKELKPVVERNTPSKLFVVTATTWNCDATREACDWLFNGINTYSTSYEQLLPITGPLFENDFDGSLKRFTSQLLHEADINIDGYEFEIKELNQEQFAMQFPPYLRSIVSVLPAQTNKRYEVKTVHHVENQDSKLDEFVMTMSEESKGTSNLFLFSPILKRAFETGEVICIDEFDTSLHPMLVLHLIGLFSDPTVNVGKAQLVVSTHTTDLLSLRILRRDQIYFVEKDRGNAISELYSLDEFSPRKTEDVRKAYLVGRYGSIPNVGEGELAWH